MDAPNPDSGEEYFHTNTQLYNTLDEHNRFKIGEAVTAPWNVPPPGTEPTMDGFVTDYISTFTGEVGRQPTYEEYAQIMTGYTPEQVPVLSGLAKGFGVFDHWFCEVPSQTFMNRSFWTAGTSSGFVVNSPAKKWTEKNTAETLFDRLEAHGRTWKVYVLEPSRLSFTGWIHMPRLKDRLATNIVPFSEFERDAANGTLPDFSLIEPTLAAGHADYHPALGRALIGGDVDIAIDPPSSILGGEDFLARIYRAIRSADSSRGLQRLQHDLLHRLGRARRHLRPRSSRSGAPAGPRRPRRGVRLHLRPLRLPRARDHRLPVDRRGHGDQRRVPPHLAARHAAQDAGIWATRSATATPPPAPSTTCSPARRRETRRAGPTCTRGPCRTGS